MPLYYFNVHNDDVTLDDEGAELADDHAARAHAIADTRARRLLGGPNGTGRRSVARLACI
ncbi:MAG: hypothetical protein JWO81_1612 [Alphaproteobacteria bacterium]|nr:hypothetical protein [Alphaproteobacteria bacterium]